MLQWKHFGEENYQNKRKPQGVLLVFVSDDEPCRMLQAEVVLSG